jgi:nitrogen fixation NifU-like protein
MSDLRELYQEVILDHNKSPRNFRKLENPSHSIEGFNPLCGDRIQLYVRLDDRGVIEDIGFQGSGCAISKASASLMSTVVKGKTREQAEALFQGFQRMVTSEIGSEADLDGLGKLAVFSGVREFPARVKCAVLAWHALNAALKGEAKPVSTE